MMNPVNDEVSLLMELVMLALYFLHRTAQVRLDEMKLIEC
jgi:hypothetical protein